jgi:hypothetical protein
MRIEIFILLLTGFFIYNSYHDGKYSKMLLSYKKYYQMAFYGLIGISIYFLLKRDPNQGKNMLLYANNFVKYMPIDKSSMHMLSPIFDLTGEKSFMGEMNGIDDEFMTSSSSPAEQRILNSGKKATKRSVSETKKKYVASMQDWKCGECKKQLNAWFEVDHKIRLEHGGGNDVQNLVALCRECHGKKTAMENM